MMFEDLFSKRLVVEVRVYLRGADVGMSEEHLDDAEIGTAFEHGRGEGVAEGVGRDGLLDARGDGLPLDHDEDHGTREVVAASVEEHVILLARFDLHLLPVLEPEFQLMDGTVGDGYEAFLVALAYDAHEVLVEVEVGEFEVRQLRDAQSAGEECLNDGAVALSLVALQVDAVFEPVHLLRRQIGRQVLRQHGRLEELRGVDLEEAVEGEVTVEGADAEEDAGLRARSDGVFVERGGKLLQVFELHLQRRQMALLEEAHVIAEVVLVSLLRVDGVVAVQLEVAHEAAHEVGLE